MAPESKDRDQAGQASQASQANNVKRGVTDDPLIWIDCEVGTLRDLLSGDR